MSLEQVLKDSIGTLYIEVPIESLSTCSRDMVVDILYTLPCSHTKIDPF
jgi:hypothetical protein